MTGPRLTAPTSSQCKGIELCKVLYSWRGCFAGTVHQIAAVMVALEDTESK